MLSFACCRRAGCSRKADKIEKQKKGRRLRSRNRKKNGGGHLPGTWALTLTRPRTVGWALTREWTLTRDNTILSGRGENKVAGAQATLNVGPRRNEQGNGMFHIVVYCHAIVMCNYTSILLQSV